MRVIIQNHIFNIYFGYRLKPQVVGTWFKYLLHYFKTTLFLIVISLISVSFEKGGISMRNFINQFINVTILYLISVIAGIQPIAYNLWRKPITFLGGSVYFITLTLQP